MMNLLNYAPFWKEAKDQEGEGIALGGLSRMQTQGDEIHPTGKSI
jgi:hypothetical protein